MQPYVGSKIGSNWGQSYVMPAISFFPRMYLGMKSIGPGRYSEMPAVRSSMDPGCSSFMNDCMPPDSIWNTPSVRPVAIDANTFGSS